MPYKNLRVHQKQIFKRILAGWQTSAACFATVKQDRNSVVMRNGKIIKYEIFIHN